MKSLIPTIVALVSTVVTASAQTPLTLDDAIARGLAASHRIGEADARREMAAAVVEQRAASQRPQIAAQAGYTRTNHVDEFGILLPNNQLRVIYPDVPDNYRTRLDASWPVYTGGRAQIVERAARQEVVAASHDVDALRADVRLEIERAFWTLVVTDESLRVMNESLTRMGAHLTNVKNALSAGLVPPNDVSTAEAQQARQRMLAIQAQSSRDIAEADLARLIGAAPGTPLQPAPPPADATIADDVAALVQRAITQRKDRQAIVDRQVSADLRTTAAMRARRPTIAFAGGVDYARPNPRIFPREAAWKTSWDAGVAVNWPLFDGGRAKADVAETRAGRRALDARLAEFDGVVGVEIRQRMSEIDASRAVIDAAIASQTAALEALRVVNDRYGAGVAISSDVLDAQLLVLQASLDRTQATASRYLALARLRRAIGE